MNIEEYQYKTELHLHTFPASACGDVSPELAVKTYLLDYDEAVKTGEKYGINVILGCEIRFTENVNDYLLFGIDKVFFELAYAF